MKTAGYIVLLIIYLGSRCFGLPGVGSISIGQSLLEVKSSYPNLTRLSRTAASEDGLSRVSFYLCTPGLIALVQNRRVVGIKITRLPRAVKQCRVGDSRKKIIQHFGRPLVLFEDHGSLCGYSGNIKYDQSIFDYRNLGVAFNLSGDSVIEVLVYRENTRPPNFLLRRAPDFPKEDRDSLDSCFPLFRTPRER